jgi:hypothetical protein
LSLRGRRRRQPLTCPRALFTSQGSTRLLLTSIPYFREVVVMSFRCEHCGENNTEIQSAGLIQGKLLCPSFSLPCLLGNVERGYTDTFPSNVSWFRFLQNEVLSTPPTSALEPTSTGRSSNPPPAPSPSPNSLLLFHPTEVSSPTLRVSFEIP